MCALPTSLGPLDLASFDLGPLGRVLFGRGRALEAAALAIGFGRRIVLVHGARPERAAWLAADLEAPCGRARRRVRGPGRAD